MPNTDLARMEAVLIGEPDPEITLAESQLRLAQLAADTRALDELIDNDLLFCGPDGKLATKSQDLDAHASGVVRFRAHEPLELRVRRVGSGTAISSLLARLVVEVSGDAVHGTFRYTRIWSRENGNWKVVGGHVSVVAG